MTPRTAPHPIPLKTLPHGFALPVYGLGTWGLGGHFEADRHDDAASVAAIRAALDTGVRHLDTAEMYGAGHTEELIGQALRGYDRAGLYLASKALAHHLDRAGLIAAAEGSLRRLGTDYLDLYMIHHPNDAVPIEETLAAMAALVERGLVRHVGVSNFSRERLAAAGRVTPVPLVVNQVHYNLAVREPERTGLLAYCQAHNILLVAWQPLIPPDQWPWLAPPAQKYGASPVQIALNWLISQDNVVVISRTKDPRHLQENLGATGWHMSAEDIAALRRDFPWQQAQSPTFALQ